MLQKTGSSDKLLYWFLSVWTALNLVQASFTGLHADEAYYWLYAKFLDWGYFDHPPMVALFIRPGDLLSHSTLGLRLLTVIASTLGVYILWLVAKKYSDNIRLYILLCSSVFIFQAYGFITTPDSPLLFFGILFLYGYQRYTENDKPKWIIFLSLIIAGLLYSKYHGVLLLAFSILSNWKLLRRPSFWLIVALSGLLFAPHIYWQYQNDFPSVYYHLFERSAKPYRLEYTTDFLLSQIIVAGPLIGWFLYRSAAGIRQSDTFIRMLKFNLYGFLLFFLLSTFKGRVEPHWTLLAFPPLLILAYVTLAKLGELKPWIKKLAYTNIALILLVRLLFIFTLPGISDIQFVSGFFNSKPWAREVKEKAGDKYVVLQGGFQEASLYNFYNNTTKGFAYDSRYYRKTQYDIWPLEDSLQHKSAYFVSYISHGTEEQDTIYKGSEVFYGRNIGEVRLYQKVQISMQAFTDTWKAGGLRSVMVKIYNPYSETINFENNATKPKCFLEYGFVKDGKVLYYNKAISKFNKMSIAAKSTASIPVIIRPPAASGTYELIFSIRTEPFSGSRNSKAIPVTIN